MCESLCVWKHIFTRSSIEWDYILSVCNPCPLSRALFISKSKVAASSVRPGRSNEERENGLRSIFIFFRQSARGGETGNTSARMRMSWHKPLPVIAWDKSQRRGLLWFQETVHLLALILRRFSKLILLKPPEVNLCLCPAYFFCEARRTYKRREIPNLKMFFFIYIYYVFGNRGYHFKVTPEWYHRNTFIN